MVIIIITSNFKYCPITKLCLENACNYTRLTGSSRFLLVKLTYLDKCDS